ncbi:hypothetical protein [Phenylobacterium sp.]|uniref:hypothetical protein n=1 Tax=Phenylobacterium sp. TaxID=1871053 RepID=UPI002F42158E
MLQINLSALNTRELRQLLDASRRRGDATLSYKVLQEMQVRREGTAKGRDGEPREFVVALDEADEAEADDLPPAPLWSPAREGPAHAAAPPEPEVEPEPDPEPALTLASAAPPKRRGARRKGAAQDLGPGPLNLDGFDAAPAQMAGADLEETDLGDVDLRLGAGAPQPPPRMARNRAQGGPPRPRKPPPRAPLGFALGLALGAALGWGVAVYREGPPALPVQTAALNPPPAPAAQPNPAEAAPAAPTVGVDGALTPNAAPTAASNAAPNAAPTAADPAHADNPAAAAPPPTPLAVAAAPAPAAPAAAGRLAEATGGGEADAADERPIRASAAGGCTAAPTPADRTICGDADLQKLQRELRRAYAEALAAHEDRALLRQRQLAWRDARNTVSDPDKLSRLYQERIRKLDAATADARRLKGEEPAT